MTIKGFMNVIMSRYRKLVFKETNVTTVEKQDRTKRKRNEKLNTTNENEMERKRVDKQKNKPQKEIAAREYDLVRSRHSTREGDGTSARWRWRVACLAPGCPRAGLSYDKADRLIHHVTRQTRCRAFWIEQLGQERVDKIVNAHKTNTLWSGGRRKILRHGFN